MRVNAVRLVTRCPKCNESVEIVITKKELKIFLKSMKFSKGKAEIVSEERLRRTGLMEKI